jgi:lipoate-protein ligase A
MTDRNIACRIVETGTTHSGRWNMACDEWLLESALQNGQAAVRVYAWSRATVSLGHFQQPDHLDDDPRLVELDRVRRLSGGGAIVHHHEWTYSCAVPPQDHRNRHGDSLYTRVHLALVNLINQITKPAGQIDTPLQLRGQAPKNDQPALCFARTAADDVVRGSHKVLGSAQRRRRGAILQHGSLLLQQSRFAPEFPGLLDLVPGLKLPDDFSVNIAHAITTALHWDALHKPLSPAEQAEIEQLADRPDKQPDQPSRS